MKLPYCPAALFAGALLVAGGSAAAQDPTTPLVPAAPALPDVIAKVNGTEITKEEAFLRFRERVGPRANGIPPEMLEASVAQMIPQLTDELVADVLFAAEFEKAGIVAGTDEVDTRFQEVLKNAPGGIGKEEFLETIGFTEEKVREGIARSIKTEKLLAPKTEGIAGATGEEAQAFYSENQEYFQTDESVRARHILIKTEGITDVTELGKKRVEIDGIRERLVGEGAEDFAEVAKEVSEGPSGPGGGDLGEFGRGQMVPEFDKVVFELEPGVVSEPVKTQFGFHLIKVDSKTPGGKTPFEEVEERITDFLTGQKKDEAVRAYIDELRKGVEIEVFVGGSPTE